MSVELNEVQKVLIDKIAKENGFNNYEVITNKGSKTGDNFLGVLTTVTIKNEEKTLELLLKSVFQNEGVENTAGLRAAYLREINLYENVFNKFKQYQEDHNIADVFDNYTKTYGSSIVQGNECFLMENLKKGGYQLWNKRQPMNSEHISLVLKGYAKFHATCMAMKHKHPELYENLTKDLTKSVWEDEDFVTNKDAFAMYISSVMEMGYTSVENYPALTKFLKIVESKMPALLDSDVDPEYLVSLVHGDSWCNNMLFKYEGSDNKRPSDVKFIDWQMLHEDSPLYDVCYFFLAHSTKEMLDDYKTYLKLYYDTLSKQLRNLNCDPDEVFPFSRFESHINRFMVIGLFMCFSILKIMLFDWVQGAHSDEIVKDEKNMDMYKERIRNLILFIKDNDFL